VRNKMLGQEQCQTGLKTQRRKSGPCNNGQGLPDNKKGTFRDGGFNVEVGGRENSGEGKASKKKGGGGPGKRITGKDRPPAIKPENKKGYRKKDGEKRKGSSTVGATERSKSCYWIKRKNPRKRATVSMRLTEIKKKKSKEGCLP